MLIIDMMAMRYRIALAVPRLIRADELKVSCFKTAVNVICGK
jgi:hypothetical protein